MAHRLFDAAFAAALCLASVWLWFVADGFPTSQRYAQADADFWPKLVLAALALASGAVAVQALRGALAARRAGGVASAPATPEATREARAAALRIAAMGGLILAYFAAFQTAGFALSTFAFLVLASYVIPYRGRAARFVFAAAFTVGLTLFFSRALGLPLPRGAGVFYDLNLIFY